MSEPTLISVTEAAHQLGVTGVEIFNRGDRGELVGVVDGGLVKIPVDQPALSSPGSTEP
jgi:hypothetical protein